MKLNNRCFFIFVTLLWVKLTLVVVRTTLCARDVRRMRNDTKIFILNTTLKYISMDYKAIQLIGFTKIPN